MAKKERTYRSRFKLLFIAWVGCWRGSHLKWLGYTDEAQQVKEVHGSIFGAIFEPAKMLGTCGYICVEMTKIMFGKYRTDAEGLPVRYFKPASSKAVAVPAEPSASAETESALGKIKPIE